MRESIAHFWGCPLEYGSFSTGFSDRLHKDKFVATIRLRHFLASALFELECARPYELQKRLRFESRAFRFLASINAGATFVVSTMLTDSNLIGSVQSFIQRVNPHASESSARTRLSKVDRFGLGFRSRPTDPQSVAMTCPLHSWLSC